MKVCVLGPIEIRSGAGAVLVPGGSRQRLLLAALALHAPRVVAAARLIDIVWEDAPPADPNGALRSRISRLRGLLGRAGAAERLRHGAAGYGLELSAEELDFATFEYLIRRARDTDDATEALSLLDAAFALWRDEPFGEFNGSHHFIGEASRLRELRMSALEQRVLLLTALGRADEAISASESLVLQDPLRERSRALAMQALYQAGRQHDALATFQEYRRLLSVELGLSPSPALRALEAEILKHERPLTAPSPQLVSIAADMHAEAAPRQDRQQIRFARSRDGVRLAYATVGAGPPIVKAANWLNHLEFDWRSPVWRRLFREIAAHRTLIRYDERGAGLSDWDAAEMSLDAWVLDLECVVDACGLDRFPLLGISQGCAVSIAYASRHPERVSALILHGGYAAGWRADASYTDAERARRDASIEIVRHGWGEDTPAYRQMFTQTFIPGGTAAEIEWFNELQRRTASPENAARFMEAFACIDVREDLHAVQAPTLVLHSRGDQRIHFERGRELAKGIPDARFVLLESDNHLVLEHEPAFDDWMSAVTSFLADTAP